MQVAERGCVQAIPFALVGSSGIMAVRKTPVRPAEGQRVSHRENVRMNNGSLNQILGSVITKLPLASYHLSTALTRGLCSRCCHQAQLTTKGPESGRPWRSE